MEKIARVTGIYKKKTRFGGRKPNALGVGLSFLTWGKLCVCVCVCLLILLITISCYAKLCAYFIQNMIKLNNRYKVINIIHINFKVLHKCQLLVILTGVPEHIS